MAFREEPLLRVLFPCMTDIVTALLPSPASPASPHAQPCTALLIQLLTELEYLSLSPSKGHVRIARLLVPEVARLFLALGALIGPHAQTILPLLFHLTHALDDQVMHTLKKSSPADLS
jgi:hypothetical protein